METLEPWIPHLSGLGGFVVGLVLTWFMLRARGQAVQARYEERSRAAHKAIVDLEAGCANMEAEVRQLRHTEANSLKRQAGLEILAQTQQRAVEEKEQLLKEAEYRMAQNFKALSTEALRTTQNEFLQLARSTFTSQQKEATSELEQRRVAVETLVKPVAVSLNKVESRIVDLEQARQESAATLSEQVRQLAEIQSGLQKETSTLTQALRQPAGRGRWGEVQLKRVVELAGMQEFCDFVTPAEAGSGQAGDPQRPDLVVNLPSGRHIVVDTHAPLEAYLSALESEDETERGEFLRRHAAQVGSHLATLASPAYRGQFRQAPEFTVLFLPSESFFSAALGQDPGLLERGLEQGVIVSTPSTLVALLRAAAAGWCQEGIAEKARVISEAGRELYSRVSSLAEHFAQVGRSLDTTVQKYNLAIGSLEGGVLPGARKLSDLGVVPPGETLPAVPEIDHAVRQPRTDLSSLPVSNRMDSMAATGEVPDESFEGFTDPAPAAVPLVKTKSGRAKVKVKAPRKTAPPDAVSPDPGAAAGDLRAASDRQKKAV